MDLLLKEKLVLVSGSTAGIGLAIAEGLARESATISRGLAESTVGTGVTVNAVLPGPTASEGVSDFVAKLATQTNQSAAEFEKFFFEKVASATNGASLPVDGGVIRTIV